MTRTILRGDSKTCFPDTQLQHCNNLPVPPRLLAASCPLACVPILTYLPPRAAFCTFAGSICADLSCSRPVGHECLTERNFDTESQYPYCYGSRPNNRLESIANAHTAADLHVRPVSQTALVSRSWAPRTLLGIHDERIPAIV